MAINSQRDRIAFGLSRAVKTYGTGFDVHVSYSTDVGENETPEGAIERAAAIVERKVIAKALRYKRKKAKSTDG